PPPRPPLPGPSDPPHHRVPEPTRAPDPVAEGRNRRHREAEPMLRVPWMSASSPSEVASRLLVATEPRGGDTRLCMTVREGFRRPRQTLVMVGDQVLHVEQEVLGSR